MIAPSALPSVTDVAVTITITTPDCPTVVSSSGVDELQRHDCNLTHLTMRCQGAEWRDVRITTREPPRIRSISFVDGHFARDRLDNGTFEQMNIDFGATEHLDLRRNNLRHVTAGAFVRFGRLQTLRLDHNPVARLSSPRSRRSPPPSAHSRSATFPPSTPTSPPC